ncbi:hypothetical protein GCM10019016_059690 [Streptomyces prasinosporus]|uniref:Uncharacterized protein n=1 Tax=Streptomyces prasinosporus TaxID=68256 RepID=A0ABP6TXQ5_9ACTN
MESELFATFSENLCQPLPAAILPGRPVMLTSTLVSSHTDGSGSGDSVSSGADVLGAGLDGDGEAVSGADWLGEALGVAVAVGCADAVDSVADGVGDASVVSPGDVSVVETLGASVGSVAYAAGAVRRATGAITAVAAATAMARRSFMKTSGSPVCRGSGTGWEAPPCGARG